MIPGIAILRAKTKACIMADIVLSGRTGNREMAMGSRDWDSLTEMGDGAEVVREFLALYLGDVHLQAAVTKYDRYIGIKNILAKHGSR